MWDSIRSHMQNASGLARVTASSTDCVTLRPQKNSVQSLLSPNLLSKKNSCLSQKLMAQTLLTLLPQTPAPKETAASNTLASKSLAAAAAAAGCRLPASIHHATDMCERQSRVREGITIAEHYSTMLLYYYISTSNYYIILLL